MPKHKQKPAEVGLKVVVTEHPAAIVYTVTEVNGNMVKLSYQDGKYSGGWIDYSICDEPTAMQLANSREG